MKAATWQDSTWLSLIERWIFGLQLLGWPTSCRSPLSENCLFQFLQKPIHFTGGMVVALLLGF
ncbi:MAG TPA: hypothetical protein PLY87_15335, partial [Planctomycetaceae bacterium]|nr:hypothetical protein [Planctomycetaceae bacterium]